MIKIENANKYFNKGKKNEIHVINNTSLEFDKTGLVALLGHSGSGKTTLLNSIGGLDKINKGKIYVNGKKITRKSSGKIDKIRNLNIGYIFQDYKLIDNMTVYENIAISLKMVGIKDKKEIKKRVDYVLECVNMYRYRNRLASMLSGGERQRVGIARAIVKNPNIVIADEPTGNLDSKNSLEIMNIIKAISKDRLVILVTHEVELAKFYASRIIEIEDGKVTSDYENTNENDLDYKIDNKFYLKDFEKIENINKDNVNLDIYSENTDTLNLKIVIKNGNVYIKSNDKKIEVIDESSNIELVDDHYKKIDKTIYQEYDYNLKEIENSNFKQKYSSICSFTQSIINGFKKIINYPVLKKILLVGFFISAMFIVYAISNITGTLNIEDEDFVSKNKNYLQIQIPTIKVEDYLKYEKVEGVNYILPGNSTVTFRMKFEDYYQTSTMDAELSGSLSSIKMISEADIVQGSLPQNEYEIVIDKMIVDKILDNTMSVVKHAGVKSAEQLIGKEVAIQNMKSFKIVGIVDKQSPSIYTSEALFVNILSNTTQSNNDLGYMVISDTQIEESADNIIDYNLKADEITLKKGRLPVNDYEVIVNISNEDTMKLNKTIKTKVNDTELTVVGYYDSSTGENSYLVNTNTVKYKLITESQNLIIYANDEETVTQNFEEDYNLFVENIYENDKADYIKQQNSTIKSRIIFASIILAISLIEIYLMMRSSFLSRIKEVGIYRAIGVKKIDIYKMFVGEIIAITSTASILGIAFMSYILNCIKQIDYFSKMFVLDFKIIAFSVILVYAFNIIVGLLPLYKVLRKTPAQILSRNDI
jgi:ABC-type lipoprotein export system ATPase subunit